MTVTPKVVMMREVHKMVTMNELRIMTLNNERFVTALDASRPGTVDAKHLSNIWRIKYEDVKRTVDVVTTCNV